MPVDEIGIGRARHVGHVGRVHPHPAPHPPFARRLVPAREQAAERLLLIVEIAALELQPAEDGVRVKRAVIRQDDHMFAVRHDRIGTFGVDHDRAVMPHLLLQPRMAVIPIGPRLHDGEVVGEGGSRRDAGKADPGHTVHLERHEQSVPVDRRLLVEAVGHRQPDLLPLFQPDQRRRAGAVDADRVAARAVDRPRHMRNGQRDIGAGQHRQRCRDPGGHGLGPGGQPGQRERAAAKRGVAEELAAGRSGHADPRAGSGHVCQVIRRRSACPS